MCLAQVQCHRPRVQGSGVSARVPGIGALASRTPDLELIAVDDCSPDACGAIIDEFAGPRPPRAPPCTCRRTRAWAAPATPASSRRPATTWSSSTATTPSPRDALRAIADRLKETGEPGRPRLRLRAHVLVGRDRPQRGLAAQLTEEGPAPFRLEDRPGLLGPADGGLEQGVPPGVRRARGLHLPARLLRGHPLDLPGPDGRRVDRDPGPGLRPLPPAPPGQHPRHHQP